MIRLAFLLLPALPLLTLGHVEASSPPSDASDLSTAWIDSFNARTKGLPGRCFVVTARHGAGAYCLYDPGVQDDEEPNFGGQPCHGEDCLIERLR